MDNGSPRCMSPMFCQNLPGDNGRYECVCPEGTIENDGNCGKILMVLKIIN